MPYCKYCLAENKAEDMPSPRTCAKCRDEQFKLGAARAKRLRKSRASRKRNAVFYYFQNKRIKHEPFPLDIANIQALLRQMITVNRYRKNLLHVDHIIPVEHPLVSGLTVSWNLQILLRSENLSKGNYCDLDLESRLLFLCIKAKGL